MDPGAKLDLLQRTPYLRSVPAGDLEALATTLRERRYRTGDVIFRRGDSSEGLGVVLSGRHPEAAIDVIRLFALRLRAYKQMVEDLSLRTVVARIARLLVDRARGAQTLVEEPASSSQQYTQDEIAAMVGSVREVVQRALKTLEHAGLIQMARGRIHIIDVEALDGWSESDKRSRQQIEQEFNRTFTSPA